MADTQKLDNKLKSNVKRKVGNKAKKKAKGLHPLTVFIAVLSLVAGVALGMFAYKSVCARDCFKIKGKSEYKVEVGTSFSYGDEGAKVISFGKDYSDKVRVKTNLTENFDGSYTADTSKEGTYYIIYTVDAPKFEGVKKVRIITVEG